MTDEEQPKKHQFAGFGEFGFTPEPKKEPPAEPVAEEPQTKEEKSKK